MEEIELCNKWRKVLGYESYEISDLPKKEWPFVARKLEEIETKYGEYPHILTHLIPMARRTNGWVYYEESEHTDDCANGGKPFKCIKMINPQKEGKRFIALPFDGSLYEADITTVQGIEHPEPYQFD